MKSAGVFPFHIQATDISRHMVEFAKVARYHGRKIEKVPPNILNRYFRPAEREGYFVVRDDLKEKIDFRVENLFQPTAKNLHCIFCRNVMIYFDRADQEKLVASFFRALKPGGYLVVGHSESLFMMNTEFEFKHFEHGVAYHKQTGGGDA